MRLVPGIVAITAVVALTACATVGVSSYRDRQTDFTNYRTFDWGPADALPTGDPRLDQNSYFQDRLQGAVERELAGRKLARSEPGGSADLLIHYHANVSRRLNVNQVDYVYGYTVDAQSQIHEYEAGTLVLDVVDTRTNEVVWRGWAHGNMTDLLEDEGKLAEWIKSAVQRMLAQLPPVY
jgi:Domain of unknown function (DUF4136)